MKHGSRTFYSNRLEQLADLLKENLFADSHPFSKRWVIVPSMPMKRWLLDRFSKDVDLQVVMGIQWGQLQDCLRRVVEEDFTKQPFPSLHELALAIEIEVSKPKSGEPKSDKSNEWLCLIEEMGFENGINSKRLVQFSTEVAKLFTQYDLYAPEMLRSWSEQPGEPDWQITLWNRLFGKNGRYMPLYEFLSRPIRKRIEGQNLQIHIFGHHYFSPEILRFYVQKLAKFFPVDIYSVSPCQHFWSDLLTDHQISSIASRKSKNGLEEALSLYSRNQILANFGVVPRAFARELEDTSFTIHGSYTLPSFCGKEPQYQALLLGEEGFEEQSPTLLQHLQSDLVLMRTPAGDEPLHIQSEDRSLELHIAPSKLREVEILYDQLIARFSNDKSLRGRDVYVLAPRIDEYAPYIEAVFSRKESPFTYQIYEMGTLQAQSYEATVWKLLDLSKSRWEATELYDLLQSSWVRRKMRWTIDDVEVILEWIQKAHIHWGKRVSHRNEVLSCRDSNDKMTDSSPSGTWSFGLSRLIRGLIQIQHEENATPSPVEGISISQANLMGSLLYFLRSVEQDLVLLNEMVELTIQQWVDYLDLFVDEYLAIDIDEVKTRRERDAFKESLFGFAKLGRGFSEKKFNWGCIQEHLKQYFDEISSSSREVRLDGIRFCSLLPMRTLPAKIIALLGLTEDRFPKKRSGNPWDRMRTHAQVKSLPTPTDYDKALFLETILSARESLILSYAEDGTEGSEGGRSILIDELFSYIDSAFQLGGEPPSSQITLKHPFSPFDPLYFSSDEHRIQSYSTLYYKAARAHYDQKKQPLQPFITGSTRDSSRLECSEMTLKEFFSAFKNPIRLYLKGMGIHFFEKNYSLQSSENLTLHPLQKYQLREEALHSTPKKAIHKAQSVGSFPIGPFSPYCASQMTHEVDEMSEWLESQQVVNEELITIQFDPMVHTPIRESKSLWKIPSPICTLNGWNIPLTGSLSSVSKEGLVLFKKKNSETYFQTLPHQVLLQVIHQAFPEIETNILFVESKKKVKISCFRDQSVERWMEYAVSCEHSLSLLMPEWAECVLFEHYETFLKKVASGLNPFVFVKDELAWISRGNDSLRIDEELFEFWKDKGVELFGHMYEMDRKES